MILKDELTLRVSYTDYMHVTRSRFLWYIASMSRYCDILWQHRQYSLALWATYYIIPMTIQSGVILSWLEGVYPVLTACSLEVLIWEASNSGTIAGCGVISQRIWSDSAAVRWGKSLQNVEWTGKWGAVLHQKLGVYDMAGTGIVATQSTPCQLVWPSLKGHVCMWVCVAYM